MFAREVLIQNALWLGGDVGVDQFGQKRHFRDLLGDDGVIDGLRGVLAPGEGAVVPADDGGNMYGVDAALAKGLDDHVSGVALVVCLDLLGCQVARTGNGAVKIIGVGGAVGGDVPTGLR